jgi:hypothetical protein
MLMQMMMQVMGDGGVYDTSCGCCFVSRSNEHEWKVKLSEHEKIFSLKDYGDMDGYSLA